MWSEAEEWLLLGCGCECLSVGIPERRLDNKWSFEFLLLLAEFWISLRGDSEDEGEQGEEWMTRRNVDGMVEEQQFMVGCRVACRIDTG